MPTTCTTSSSTSSTSAAAAAGADDSQAAKSYPAIPPIYSLLLSLPSLVAPFLPADLVAAYPTAVQALLPSLDPIDARLRELLPKSANWTHDFITALQLSGRWTLATDVKASFLLAGRSRSREEAAARVLWAVGVWRRDGFGGRKSKEIGWQTDGLLGGFHVPGRECDNVQLASGDLGEAVVWVAGRAWAVEVFRMGEVVSVEEIRAQLEGIVRKAAGRETANISVAALSHRLPRELWAKTKASLSSDTRTNMTMNRLYSSLTTLALEDYVLPHPTSDALEDIRGNCDSPNRFADQTLSFVVYSDGAVGMTTDHTVADCSAGLETALWLSELAAKADVGRRLYQVRARPPKELSFPALITACKMLPMYNGPRAGEPVLFTPAPRKAPMPRGYTDNVARSVRTLSLRLPKELLQKRLVDATLQLALQAAVGRDTPITQSVYQRGTANARSEPVMAVTEEGVRFIEMLADADVPPEERETAFQVAVAARGERIKSNTFPFYRNLFLHPSFSMLPPSPELSTILAVLHVASGAPVECEQPGSNVQFTGFTISKNDNVAAASSNLYLEQQLVACYLAKVDEDQEEDDGSVEITFSASGEFWRAELDDVVLSFAGVWELILEAALGRGGGWEGVV